MANEISLMSYLQQPIATNPPSTNPSNNILFSNPWVKSTLTTPETNLSKPILIPNPWEEFNLPTILQRHHQLLKQVHLPPDPTPIPTSTLPTDFPWCELHNHVMPRVRRALNASFEHLNLPIPYQESNNPPHNKTPIPATDFKSATGATWPPDPVNYRGGDRYPHNMNQVSVYAGNTGDTPYGFLIRDQELVFSKRVYLDGNILIARPVCFTAGGTDAEPVLTPLLALWAFCMLGACASDGDEGGDCWVL
ncbi:hypothetical protein BO94DRAFT_544996 [Aspergillus sclerotioniger CBS 115572]|uniref:Uncharacterized protein n=1 Tax=Aspergillus sclerotioniger CBS 115572 TaxID=1450535 RepID=A0A317X257_9EURO|nr:hypothetical protein BO94DRAFT_544996 [Aspergillus sclerotioniger CBS 115572]PWY91637.1 hypothetical protein BO94DRAFT_544996 [Aspergillus sclerotioniger CBS 115572]